MDKVIWPVDELHEWDKNPRNITSSAFARLKKQISKLGQYKPLIITSDGEVLGGNMRLKAYRDLGINEAWVSVIEPKDENEKLEYALSDNDRAGYYDDDLLANLMPNYDIDWSAYAVDIKEPTNLKDLLDQFQEVVEDEVPDVTDEPAVSKLGEVYQLGRHRLMCGDSTKIEDVEKLMNGQKADMVFTDPPYGVSYGDKNVFLNMISPANRIEENIFNDTKTVSEMKGIWVFAFSCMNAVSKAGGSYYVCSPQGGELMMMMMMSLLESGWDLRQSIIWVKNNHVLGRSDYHYKHEPILYGWKEGAGHKFYGQAGETTVWEIAKPQKSDLHPTMKPVALCARAIKNSSKEDDLVLDLFGGSGSTLIACEQTNRICYMMELDPKYCDIIRKRYAKFIGKGDQWQTITTSL